MPGLWIKVDADFHLDARMMRAGPLAQLLHIRAMGFCRKMLTDGRITEGQVASLTYDMPDAPALIELLEAQGDADAPLWTPIDGGWVIGSYGDLNQSKAEIEDITAKRRKGGKARADKARDAEHMLSTCSTHAEVGADAVSEHHCSTLLSSSLAVGSTDTPATEIEPDDPDYTYDPTYNGIPDMEDWEQRVGPISPSQRLLAQNALIRAHSHFKRSRDQIAAMITHIATDSDAKRFWGTRKSPSGWLKTDGDGVHTWEKILAHLESAEVESSGGREVDNSLAELIASL